MELDEANPLNLKPHFPSPSPEHRNRLMGIANKRTHQNSQKAQLQFPHAIQQKGSSEEA